MTRPIIRLGLIAAVAAVGMLSGAGQAAAASDRAAGVFSDIGEFSSFKTSFVAASGPFGQHPAGVASLRTTFIDIFGQPAMMRGSGHVTCLDVAGNQAAISVALSRPVPFPIGTLARSFQIFAIDNGFAPTAPTDLVVGGFSPNPSAPAQTIGCDVSGGSTPQQDRLGDVVVRDATK